MLQSSDRGTENSSKKYKKEFETYENNKIKQSQYATRTTQKGITLIALVITIIVLLILAGVAINLAVDANGLFSKANEATTKWNNRVAEEGSSIKDMLAQLDMMAKGWDTSKIGSVVTETSKLNEKDEKEVAKERTAPIPTGFTASQIETEKTIAGGLVIYETGNDDTTSEDFWTKTTEIEGRQVPEVQTKYNQYVWIPVDDINSMIMCSKNNTAGKDGVTECSIVEQNGTLVCEVHEDSPELVGRLYDITSSYRTDGSNNKIYTYTVDFSKTDQTYDANSGSREPAIVTGNSNGDGSSYDGSSYDYHGAGSATAFLSQLQEDFYAMANSVYTYGGFYIARYEAGAEGASKKNQDILTAATSSGTNYLAANNWYGLYNTLRKAGTTTTPNSHMIWGSQYDTVLKFIGSEAETGHVDRQEKTIQKSGMKTTEGKTDNILKNIYDLEGNCYEWTAMAYGTSYRVHRGRFLRRCKLWQFLPSFLPRQLLLQSDEQLLLLFFPCLTLLVVLYAGCEIVKIRVV